MAGKEQETKETIEEEVIDPIVEDQDDVDPNAMDLDDIEALEKKDDDSVADDDKKSEVKDDSEKDKDSSDDSDVSDKDDDKKVDDSDKDPEVTAETDPTELKRVEDLRRLTTKAQQKASDLTKQLQEARQKINELKKGSFEELNEEDEKALREDDPDAYLDYKEAKGKHDQEIADQEAELVDNAIKIQAAEINSFTLDRLGIELDLTIDPDDQPDEIKELLKPDGKLAQVESYLQENTIAKDGVYTAKQMDAAYKALFHDELIAEANKGVREQTLDSIETAAAGGSVLDRASSDGEGAKSGKVNVDDLSLDDINNMSEKEADRLLAEIE